VYKLIALLLILIAALQYRLWLGDGGIREFREINQRIEELKQEGEQRKVRNAAVEADVRDLRDGLDAIEERARHELGMIKPGEFFVQIYDTTPPRAALPPEPPPRAAPAKRRPKAGSAALKSKPAPKPGSVAGSSQSPVKKPRAQAAKPQPGR
jgi:cell division protein FtsB